MSSPRKFLILAKEEVTQYTDPVPTPAANSILVKNLKVTPLRVESEDRALMRPYLGNSEQIPVMEEAVIEFDVELAGGGTPLATVPKWGPLMKACAFGETVVAVTSVTYAPISTTFKYVTIYAYLDGILAKMTGCAGSVSLEAAAKRLPHLKFRFVGKYLPVTDVAIPGSSDFSAFQQPKASIPANTGTTTVDGYAARVAAVSLDMSNEISHALWMNAETNEITDRKPRGSIVVEEVTVATKDYWTLVRNATLVAFAWMHGTVSGNRVQVTAPKLQLVDVERTTFEGANALRFNVTFNPNTGNDEVAIVCT